MVIATRRNKTDGLAFTLLEMLLTVALLVALLGAVVYNFESARRGSDLEEGARQVEALVRFAGAHAANNGRAIQIRFGDDVTTETGTNSTSEFTEPALNDFPSMDESADSEGKLRVVWEVDPVAQPGVFVDLREAAAFLEAIADRVRVQKLRMPEALMNLRTNDLTYVQDVPVTAPSVMFYPDGSSDTAEIVLTSNDREDLREAIVHLDGVTGGVRTELKVYDEFVPIEWMDDEGTNAAPSPQQTGVSAEPKAETSSVTESATTPMPEDPAFEDLEKPDTTTATNIFDDDLP